MAPNTLTFTQMPTNCLALRQGLWCTKHCQALRMQSVRMPCRPFLVSREGIMKIGASTLDHQCSDGGLMAACAGKLCESHPSGPVAGRVDESFRGRQPKMLSLLEGELGGREGQKGPVSGPVAKWEHRLYQPRHRPPQQVSAETWQFHEHVQAGGPLGCSAQAPC